MVVVVVVVVVCVCGGGTRGKHGVAIHTCRKLAGKRDERSACCDAHQLLELVTHATGLPACLLCRYLDACKTFILFVHSGPLRTAGPGPAPCSPHGKGRGSCGARSAVQAAAGVA